MKKKPVYEWRSVPNNWTGKPHWEVLECMEGFIDEQIEKGYKPVACPWNHHRWLFEKIK